MPFFTQKPHLFSTSPHNWHRHQSTHFLLHPFFQLGKFFILCVDHIFSILLNIGLDFGKGEKSQGPRWVGWGVQKVDLRSTKEDNGLGGSTYRSNVSGHSSLRSAQMSSLKSGKRLLDSSELMLHCQDELPASWNFLRARALENNVVIILL